MKILLIGGPSSLTNKLIVKLRKERHKVFLVTGQRNKNVYFEKTFERFDFPYDGESMHQIFHSVRPDLTIFMGAQDSNFDWEKVRFAVNEGASVLKGDDKIFVFFSASGTGAEYCMGYLWADSDADLMDISSWHKTTEPVLSTKELTGEAGPGHNSFVYDEEGNLLLVYHARPESHFDKSCGTYDDEPLYDPCRHARIKYVKLDEKGFPVIL